MFFHLRKAFSIFLVFSAEPLRGRTAMRPGTDSENEESVQPEIGCTQMKEQVIQRSRLDYEWGIVSVRAIHESPPGVSIPHLPVNMLDGAGVFC